MLCQLFESQHSVLSNAFRAVFTISGSNPILHIFRFSQSTDRFASPPYFRFLSSRCAMSQSKRVARLGLKMPICRPLWQRRRSFGVPIGVKSLAEVPLARRRRKWVARDVSHFEQLVQVGEGTYGCVLFAHCAVLLSRIVILSSRL